MTEGWMPLVRLLRRLAIALAVVFGLSNIGVVKFVRDAYPADPYKSHALSQCLAAEPGFIRFSAADRERCYARQPRRTVGMVTGAE